MARNHDDESDSSFADSQYDMVDDISELSNDDRETASLGSTEQHDSEGDGQLTPEGSIVDVQDERERVLPRAEDTFAVHTSQGTVIDWQDALNEDSEAATRNKQARTENELIDSYLSEDETPRQSTIRRFSSKSSPLRQVPYPVKDPSSFQESSDAITTRLRILFCSERDVPAAAVERVCSRIAFCVSNSGGDDSDCEVLRLPPTPTGINPTLSLVIRNKQVEVTIQRCINANIRSSKPESFNLHVLDADSKHASIFTVGQNRKVELDIPDLVVFYLDLVPDYPNWFTTIKQAMIPSEVPNMTIGGPMVLFKGFPPPQQDRLGDTDIMLGHDDFFSDDNEDLKDDLNIVLRPRLQPEPDKNSTQQRNTRQKKKVTYQLMWKDLKKYLLALLLILALFLFSRVYQDAPSPVIEMVLRREALSAAIVKMTNLTDSVNAFNIDHLIPHPATTPPKDDFLASVHYQGVQPNHLTISLLKSPSRRRFPEPVKICVDDADGHAIAFNVTKLIDGIYDVSIAPQEAYGQVYCKMFLKSPTVNFTVSHNYGKSFEKARLDFNKAINKNADVARQNAKSLKEKFALELSAGAVATKNVTTQIALYAARDLQVFANTAVSVFGKAAAASNGTATRIRKDFVLVQKDLVKFTKDVQQYASSAAQSAKALIPTKKTISSPLAISRERALGLKQLLSRRKKEANSTSASKELSLRLQNIFNPSEKSKKAGSLSDIARCVTARDYKACRKEQKAVPSFRTPSSLSTVPGENVFEQILREHKPSSARDLKAREAAESVKSMTKAMKKADGELKKAKKKMDRAARRRARKEERAQRKRDSA